MAPASERRPTCQCSVRPDVLNGPLLGNDRITLPCNDLCAEVAAGRSRRIVGRSEVGRPLIATLPPYRPAFINREGPTTLCNLTVNGLHREVPYARGGSQEKNLSSVAP